MKGIGFLLALGLALSAAPAVGGGSLGPGTAELLGRSVTPQDYPDEDVVVLFRGVEIAVDADGRATRRLRLVRRLLTDRAIEQYGDERIPVDTTRQELTVDICRTFMLDGREVPARPNSMNRVTPDRVAGCPDLAGLQEMAVTHLGVERGCLVEIETTLSDRFPWRPWLEGIEELGGEAPVLEGSVRIEAPGLAGKLVGEAGELVGEAGARFEPIPGGGGIWRYGPLPGCPDEGGLADQERWAYLVFSTCPSWEELGRRLRLRLEAASLPDEAIRAWAAGPLESGRPALNDEERFARTARLITERTADADVMPWAWWLPVRPAARTFDTSCGDLLDRAALAAATFRAAGLSADLALRPAASTIVREVPALIQFDDLWWRSDRWSMSVGSGAVGAILDPGHADELRVLAADEVRFLPLPPRVARSRLEIRLHQEEDRTVRGEAALRIGGAVCAHISIADLKGFLDRFASEVVEEGTVAGYRVEALGDDTLAVTLSLVGMDLGEPVGGGRRRIDLPAVPGMIEAAFPPADRISRLERRSVLKIRYLVDETVDLRLELPDGTRPLLLPRSQELRVEGAVLEIRSEKDGTAWRFHRRFATDRGEIGPDAYRDFREVVLLRLDGSVGGIYVGSVAGGE